ncbi:MAG: L-serine ammonia-lyase, iron-sulfur-dependent, subunit alpha [Methanobacterium sp.]|uniref:L-cysteine desulfidase family protein n=1 Tax=Methanobacterium sp. TaxID=2164 RepID=UPI003C778D2B
MEEEKFLSLLNEELIIALGCTEPTAIAIAAATARKYVRGTNILNVDVKASRNVIKNALSVGIPGTDSCGINLAAALGIFAYDSDKNLQILAKIKPSDIKKAIRMVKQNIITVKLADTHKKLYIEIVVKTDISYSRVVIEDNHDNIVLIEVDGNIIKNNQCKDTLNSTSKTKTLDYLNLDSILEFIENVNIEKLDLIKQCIEINTEICLEGLKKPYGLSVGRSIKNKMKMGFLADDTVNYATALTAAGSDARMAGSSLPVMSNSGSGNQGISTTMPVVVFGEGSDEEKIIRAVTLSNLVTIYIKLKLGRLSALCGASISATGACCGITYLMGGDESQIKSSIQNMMGNLTGMICDGAKAGCALKVATCTNAAIQSAIITLEGNIIGSSDGIIEENAADTIENFCTIGNIGMMEADKLILDIMLKKNNCTLKG